MYKGKSICVVIPAYNEEKLISSTVRGVPDYVDSIVVCDDCSDDSTVEIVRLLCKDIPKLTLLENKVNGGVGVAIRNGYIWCRENNIDIAAVMAGDGQMDPSDMPALLDPVVEDRTDYAKGNRLVTGEAWEKIPRTRYIGNSGLTFLTKIASGYWHVTDSQSGYTAINRKALKLIPLEEIFPRYGMPNDLLVTLNIYGMRVSDVPVRPIYGIGEQSGIKVHKVLFTLSFLLMRLFCKRMFQKYVVRDFHPLVLFYTMGAFLLILDIPLAIRLIIYWAENGHIPPINALAIIFCTFLGSQSILFAMLFDMEANRDLKGQL